ncbi:MAG: arginine--tRNA ligase [Alphaproteobacteria bacterium]|nr:arginine--tRNA ligase [Alphaproteobacteria bacterium]
MNLFTFFRDAISAILGRLVSAGTLPATVLDTRLTVEPPRDASHGDVSSNAALVLSKAAGRKPREIAELLAAELRGHPDVAGVEIAGPGFINLRLHPAFWTKRLADILTAGEDYGTSTLGAGKRVNVEYVSANPTGPMHVGHGRGAVLGDALAALLARTGHDVTREYYINDAGGQVDTLARSAYLRYREALGEAITIPEGLYPGEYLKPVGAALAARHGRALLDKPEAAWLALIRAETIAAMMALIRDDLAALGVRHDVFVSERDDVVAKGKVEQAVESLRRRDLVYRGVLEPPKGEKPDDWEPREQLLFRATAFGDVVDRPLQKSDGTWTYFASDMAYHHGKVERGFDRLIDVWGADHKGYVKRMEAAVKALRGDRDTQFEVKLCELVNLLENGEPVRMSKRSGTFVTLREVIDRVGAGVVRFIMLTRRSEQTLDFDFAKVTEQSKDNPVFYVQYAHARTRSVMRQAETALPGLDLSAAALAGVPLDRLQSKAEFVALIKTLAFWPRLLESAAETGEPHRVAFFLYDLAAQFHQLWTHGKDDHELRIVVAEDRDGTLARLALVRAVGYVVASGLRLIGVEPAESM